MSTLWTNIARLKDIGFSPLQEVDLDCAKQTSIPQHRFDMFTTCAIHYNFDLSSVIRYTGGNYTNVHLKVESILKTLSMLAVIKHLWMN